MTDAAVRTFTDRRIVLAPHLGTTAVAVLCVAAGLAILLSVLSLLDRRVRDRAPTLLGGRAGTGLLIGLRALGVLLCLATALEPRLETREVARVPNEIAVLVDTSRSMEVRPPDGGASRAARAHALLRGAEPLFERWQRQGHRVELYGFGEALTPATTEGLAAPPAGEATRLGEALGELRTRTAGRDLGAVIVVSDGIDTGRIGEGPLDGETRRQLEALNAPVHAVGIGERGVRDLSVAAVLADEFAFVRTPVVIEALLHQAGLPGRHVEVVLSVDGRTIAARPVELHGDRSTERVAFDWTPDHPGQFVFRVETPVLTGEALSTNNAQVFTVRVIRDRVRVLHVCGRPSWDERFLRAMLRRDPNVDLVSFFILRTETDEQPWNRNELSLIPFPTWEIFDEQLHTFDLVIFQNFNFGPYGVEPFLPGLREYVDAGGAFAMVGGDLSFSSGGYGSTPLKDVLPVELDQGGDTDRRFSTESYRPRLTPEGRTHPITALALDGHDNEQRWARLPALEGLNRVVGVKSGAATLLAHPTAKTGGKPTPVLVVGDAGKGRAMALLTDSAWHWGFMAAGAGDDGRTFQRFWENAIRWLVRDPAMTLLRIDLDRAEYLRSQSPSVRVRTMRPDYTPAAGVQVALELTASEAAAGAPPLKALTLTSDDRGEIHSDLGPLPAGAYRLRGRATIAGAPALEEKLFSVRSEGRELQDVAYRPAVLRQLAEASGGTFQEGKLGEISMKEAREVRVGRRTSVELWSSPLFLVAGLLVLSLEWLLRRRAGFR